MLYEGMILVGEDVVKGKTKCCTLHGTVCATVLVSIPGVTLAGELRDPGKLRS